MSFSISAHILFQDSIQDIYHIGLVVTSPQFRAIYNSFSVFLILSLNDLHGLMEYFWASCRMSCSQGQSDVFSWFDWGHRLWGRLLQRGGALPLSPDIRGQVYVGMTWMTLDFITWLRQGFPGFSTLKLFFLPFRTLFFGSKSQSPTHITWA